MQAGVIGMEALGDKTSMVAASPRTSPRRLLRFENIEVRQTAPESYACRVTLSGPYDRIFMGEGTSVVLGVATTAAARATLRALEAYTGSLLTLESIRKTHVGGRELILVIVSMSGHPRQELTGAVVVRGDESRAAALAVLDATNRWVERHSQRSFTSS